MNFFIIKKTFAHIFCLYIADEFFAIAGISIFIFDTIKKCEK